MKNTGFVHKIGRFEVLSTLGKGAQSTVYLGFDPHLEREVAIKTVHFGKEGGVQGQMLIQEARTVSKLRHPNIIPIFEAGEHDGDPYLVFEYVEGRTLGDALAAEGAMPVNRAVEILIQVLDAIADAHRHGIIHRDLKPSNIVMNAQGVPRVMDFGIAIRVSADNPDNLDLSGTPAYMAPEYIAGKGISTQSDIFAAGLILIEMITGKRAVQGSEVIQIFNRITGGVLFSAAELGEFIDEKLGNILLRAIAPNPADRYADALDMKEALQAYLKPSDSGPGRSEEAKQSTLDFLLRRMKHKSDFPALSESVSAINKIVSSETENINKLSNAVLRDFALANKVLKLVNSVFYVQYGGGTISTISRAVVILGFDAVRNIAVTLVLFEHLQNKAHASHLLDDFIRTLFSAILAKVIAARSGYKEIEEAFICAMFHNLGRLLAVFYFPEEMLEIDKRIQHDQLSEEKASEQVLGISFQDMGVGIARTWGFPDQIVHSMRRLPDGPVKKPDSQQERLRILAEYCHELCEMVANTPRDQKAGSLKKIAARFGSHAPLTDKDLIPALDQALEEVMQYAGVIRLNLRQSKFGKQLAEWMRQGVATSPGGPADAAATIVGETRLTAESGVLKASGPSERGEVRDPQSILADGIQDISNSLVEGIALNDVLRMILETMYRGMGFQHVLLCVRDGKQGTMNGRFGFGEDIAALAKNFHFPLAFSADVFHAALDKGADILIADTNDPKILTHIPDWYRDVVTAQTFVLFPLTMKSTPVALIYADKAFPGEISFNEKELSLLRTLRNQALLAIKQSL
ncbi:MAG: HDOD domain-containing protein [Sulfuricella sp.]|nr:HDOD domain-containing protein [Sulfuricella sp.]